MSHLGDPAGTWRRTMGRFRCVLMNEVGSGGLQLDPQNHMEVKITSHHEEEPSMIHELEREESGST